MPHILIDARWLGKTEEMDAYILHVLSQIRETADIFTYSVLTNNAQGRRVKIISEKFNILPFEWETSSVLGSLVFFFFRKKHSFDLIHFLSDTPLFLLPKNRILSQRTISHLIIPETNAVKRFFQRIEKYCLERRSIHSLGIIMESEYSKRLFLELFPSLQSEKIFILPPVLHDAWKEYYEEKDVDLVRKAYATGEQYFLVDAITHGYGGAVRIIRAFSKFVKKHPQAKLVFIGKEDPHNHSLRDEIIRNDLRLKVLLIGKVTEKEKACLVKGSLGMVFSSLYSENTLPFLESQTLRVPLAYSDIWALENHNFPFSYPFHPLREESIWEAFEFLLNTPRSKVKELPKEEKFNNSVITDLYKKILIP